MTLDTAWFFSIEFSVNMETGILEKTFASHAIGTGSLYFINVKKTEGTSTDI